MDGQYLIPLAHEFRAGEGSFLLQLRIDMYWDKDAFRRLTEAMPVCCNETLFLFFLLWKRRRDAQQRFT
jgi:hypothetical protein